MRLLRLNNLACLILIMAVACHSPETKQPTGNNIAIFDGGTVSEKDLDLAIMELNAANRVVQKEERLAWYERLAKDIAISKLMIEEQQAKGTLNQSPFPELAYQAARRVQSDNYINLNMAPVPLPTQEDLEQQFKTLYGEGKRQGRALLKNIFIRYTATKGKAEVEAELHSLRERVLAGENFGQLAAKHSDSETRHREGTLGSMPKDQMSPELAKIIFALNPNEPSKPLFTKDGGHLFQAEHIIPEKFFTLEEVRQQLVVAHQQEAYLEALKGLAEKFPKPSPFQFQEKEQLMASLAQNNPSQVLIQVGETSITTAEFLDYLTKELKRTHSPEDGWDKNQVYTDQVDLAYREWLYQAIKPNSGMVEPGLMDSFTTKRNQLWTDQLIRVALLEDVLTEQEALKTYYENQKTRFQLPPKVRLQILTIPQNTGLPQMMAELESTLPELKTNKTNLETLAEKYHGKLAETEPVTAQALRIHGSKLYKFAFEVPEGGYSPPFRMKQGLTIFKVLEKIPPQIQPFNIARKQVAQDFILHQGQILYQKFADEMLGNAQFNFSEEAAKRHGKLSD